MINQRFCWMQFDTATNIIARILNNGINYIHFLYKFLLKISALRFINNNIITPALCITYAAKIL